MGYDRVYDLGSTRRIFVIINVSLAQRTGNKTIFGIGYGLLAILVYYITKTLFFPVTHFKNLFSVGQSLYYLFQVFVVLQQLDGKEACRVLMADLLIDTDNTLHLLNASFQFRTMIDVNMAVRATRVLTFFLMSAKAMVGNILLVPVAQIIQHFGAYFAFLIKEIAPFVNADNYMKQFVNPLPATTDRRYHRRTKELPKHHIVQCIATGCQFIVHIERDYHTHVHVNQLGGEIKVPFQIGRIYHIDYNVRSFINDMTANINFFG